MAPKYPPDMASARPSTPLAITTFSGAGKNSSATAALVSKRPIPKVLFTSPSKRSSSSPSTASSTTASPPIICAFSMPRSTRASSVTSGISPARTCKMGTPLRAASGEIIRESGGAAPFTINTLSNTSASSSSPPAAATSSSAIYLAINWAVSWRVTPAIRSTSKS